MMKTKKHNTSNNEFIKGEAVGLLSGLSFALISALMISYLVLNESVPLKSVDIIAPVAMFISAYLGNVISTKIIKKNTLITGMIFAGLYLFIILILNVTLFNVPTSKLLISGVSIILGALTVCVNNIIPKKNRGYKKVRHG